MARVKWVLVPRPPPFPGRAGYHTCALCSAEGCGQHPLCAWLWEDPRVLPGWGGTTISAGLQQTQHALGLRGLIQVPLPPGTVLGTLRAQWACCP